MPKILLHRARLRLAEGSHAQGRRRARHGQCHAHHGGYSGGRTFQHLPLYRIHGLPGGCLGGGGQPICTPTPEIRAARAKAIYGEDAVYVVRKSHENEDVLRVYDEFLKHGPAAHKSHALLHTHYTARD